MSTHTVQFVISLPYLDGMHDNIEKEEYFLEELGKALTVQITMYMNQAAAWARHQKIEVGQNIDPKLATAMAAHHINAACHEAGSDCIASLMYPGELVDPNMLDIHEISVVRPS